MMAALVLPPYPRPSQKPAPMATMFLRAPHSSTPTVSFTIPTCDGARSESSSETQHSLYFILYTTPHTLYNTRETRHSCREEWYAHRDENIPALQTRHYFILYTRTLYFIPALQTRHYQHPPSPPPSLSLSSSLSLSQGGRLLADVCVGCV